jgi:hypothetical protein
MIAGSGIAGALALVSALGPPGARQPAQAGPAPGQPAIPRVSGPTIPPSPVMPPATVRAPAGQPPEPAQSTGQLSSSHPATDAARPNWPGASAGARSGHGRADGKHPFRREGQCACRPLRTRGTPLKVFARNTGWLQVGQEEPWG